MGARPKPKRGADEFAFTISDQRLGSRTRCALHQRDWPTTPGRHSVAGAIRHSGYRAEVGTGVSTIERWFGINVVPLHTQVVGDVRGVLFILLGAVGFVLLISCTNVANLMLARATQRGREIAIRTAVGASQYRLIRQLLTESLLLSMVGGLAGLVVSVWAVDLFIRLSPGDIPRLSEASVDLRLLGFTLLVSLLTGVGFGLLPAFQATRTNLNTSLKEGGTKASEGRQRRSARNILVVTEIALAQVLLVGAALLAISYVRVTQIKPGFNPDRVLTAKIAPSTKKYPDPGSRSTFYTTVLDRLRSLPGLNRRGW